MEKPDHAVMLAALGGVESLNDIEPFLTKIMKGRAPSEMQIEEIRKRYQLIGGKSPLNDITKRQAKLLEEKFKSNGMDTQVFTGFLFTPPFITEVLNEISEQGIKNVTVLNIAPQRSERMICHYRDEIDSAIPEMESPPNIAFFSGYHDNEHFLKGMAARVKEALDNIDRGKSFVIFTAHSLPARDVDRTDRYEEEVKATVQGILKYTGELSHTLAYQSKGFSQGDWFGPSVDYVIENLEDSVKNILFVPAGFISDNLEILYDIDIYCKKLVEEKGKNFFRSESLNDSPFLIEALYTRIKEIMEV